MPFDLPDWDIKDSDVLHDRMRVALQICDQFIREVEQHHNVNTSDWDVVDLDGEYSLKYMPRGIRSADTPEEIILSVKKMWLESRERWPQVFTKGGFLGMVMSHGTEGLDADEFAKLFRAQADDHEEKEA